MKRYLSVAVVTAVIVIYAVMAYLVPAQLDDLEFMSVYLGYNGESDGFSLSAWWNLSRYLWEYDNARLANVLSPIMNLITPWRHIYWLISGIMMGLLLTLVLKEAGEGLRSAKVTVLAWAMIIVLLPWRDCMFVLDYSLNYLYGAVFALAYLYLLARSADKTPSAAGTVMLLLLAAVVGLWHEGFSSTAIAGAAAVVARHRFRVCRQCYAAILITAAGTLYLLTCPGIVRRAAHDVGAALSTMNWRVLIDSVSMLLTLGSVVLFSLTSRGRALLRSLMKSDLFLAVLCCGIAGMLLSVGVRHSPRMSFWPGVCGIILLLRIWLPVLRHHIGRVAAGAAAAVLLAGCMLQSGMAITAQKRYFDEYKVIMAQFLSGKNTVYHDIIQPREPSMLTLYFPARTAWINGFNYHCFAHLLKRDYLAVVPASLKHYPEEPDTITRKGAAFPVIRTREAVFTDWMPGLNCRIPVQVRVKPRGGDFENMDFNAVNFTTEEGDSLSLLLPLRLTPADIDSLEILHYEISSDFRPQE